MYIHITICTGLAKKFIGDVDSGEGYICVGEKIIEKIYLPFNFPINLKLL